MDVLDGIALTLIGGALLYGAVRATAAAGVTVPDLGVPACWLIFTAAFFAVRTAWRV